MLLISLSTFNLIYLVISIEYNYKTSSPYAAPHALLNFTHPLWPIILSPLSAKNLRTPCHQPCTDRCKKGDLVTSQSHSVTQSLSHKTSYGHHEALILAMMTYQVITLKVHTEMRRTTKKIKLTRLCTD